MITKAIVRLFDSERFYAELIMQMNRVVSDRVPTLGVTIKDKIYLHINPKFFASISPEEQVAVLKHECQHILHDHIPRSKDFAPDVYKEGDTDIVDSVINQAKHQVINIAADLSINPGIPDLPAGAVYPSDFKLPKGHTLEFYANELKDNENLKNLNTIGDHSLWSESEGDKEMLKEKVKQAVKNAAANTRSAGKMTADLELLVDRLNHIPKDWRSDLRRFVSRSMEVNIDTSRKKRNRRYGISQPGMVKEERLHIGVAIDTSGSISDEALSQFMAEIANIAKYAEVTVVEADSEVKNSYKFDAKKTYKVAGRGGTAYQPAFDFFSKETDVDGVIYLGDMDCFGEKLIKPKYPVMWAIIGTQEPPAKWGSVTKVEVKRKG